MRKGRAVMPSLMKLIKKPAKIVYILDWMNLSKWIPDSMYLKMKYRASFDRPLDLKNPQTFNEKLQWLKLYDRKPFYTDLVDKYKVKQYVAERIGEEYIIPTLGVWDSVEDIDFDSLPNQFVLKCTHDSGGLVICKDKKTLDINEAKRKLRKALKNDFYACGREWPYKNVTRRIIAEQYMEDNATAELMDYKVHNFSGEPRFILVCGKRFSTTGVTEDYFTEEWKRMAVKWPDYPNSKLPLEKPEQLDQILEFSRILAAGLPFVRSDFYIVNGKVFFGELTFFPANGFLNFEPDEWDYTFGSWIQLPKK